MKRAGLAATIKARWICEQAHQQLKEKLGLDHFEGRSWQGLHRHALMTMIAYAFLQHRHLTQVGRKKESTDHRLSLACRPYATPSSISFFDHYLSNAHTAEDEAVKNSGVGKSAKVVLGRVLINRDSLAQLERCPLSEALRTQTGHHLRSAPNVTLRNAANWEARPLRAFSLVAKVLFCRAAEIGRKIVALIGSFATRHSPAIGP
jgi:hypothetical protein